MNNSLLNKLIKKIEGEKLFINPNDVKIFEGLTEAELEKIISLDSKKFQEFIKLVLSFTKALNVSVFKSKLQAITKLLINNIDNISYKQLVEILTNTKIITSNQLLEFSRLFLTINDSYKVKTIKEVLLSNSNIDLIGFLELITPIDNHLKLDILKKIYIRKCIIYPYKFQELVSFISNSNQSVLDSLNECLKCDKLLRSHDIMTYLNYLKKCDNLGDSKIWSVSLILRNEYMLESTSLKKLLNTIVNLKSDFYLQYIDTLVNRKKFIPDNIFDKMLSTIFKFTKNYQIEIFLSIMRNPRITYSNYNIDLLSEYIKKANEIQTIYIKKLANQPEYLDDSRIISVLDLLINTKKAIKLSCIVELVKYIIYTENFFSMLEIIKNIKNDLACNYLCELIKFRPNLVDENIILIENFVNLEFSLQLSFILYIIKSNKLSDYQTISLIKMMGLISNNQLKLIDTIIVGTSISQRDDCIKYVEEVLDISEDYKIKVLNQILLNNPNITWDKFNLVVNLIKKFKHSELKFVLNEVLNEVTPDGEKIVVNQKRKIKKK